MRAGRIPPAIETIDLDGTTVSYTVRRSARAKYMRITISPHNGVVVTLPTRLRRYVNPDKLLKEKKEWVLSHLEKLPLPPAPSPIRDGSTVHYMGREFRLRVKSGGLLQGCEITGNELRVTIPPDFEGDLKEVVREWIRERAAEKIGREVEKLAEQIKVRYNRVSIRDQKTKWGSCSKRGNLSFNWRLILFPPRILRYVVIHELCHLKHFNHSSRFWDLVEEHDPRYRDSITWLKQNGALVEGDLR